MPLLAFSDTKDFRITKDYTGGGYLVGAFTVPWLQFEEAPWYYLFREKIEGAGLAGETFTSITSACSALGQKTGWRTCTYTIEKQKYMWIGSNVPYDVQDRRVEYARDHKYRYHKHSGSPSGGRYSIKGEVALAT